MASLWEASLPQDHRGRLEQAQIDTNKKMANWTMVVGMFTAVLAVVSIITGLFVWWQAYTAARVAEDTREQLRAVMQFTGVQTLSGPAPDNAGQIYGFLSTFQNLGGTRAGNVTAWHSVAYYSGSVPNNIDFSKPKDVVGNASNGAVGANSQIAIVPVTLKVGEVESALRKEGVIVLWGKLSYRDIYDPKTEHIVTFCQAITPTQSKGSSLISFGVTPLSGDCNSSK